MVVDRDGAVVAQELRERAAAFVNDHVDLWVTAEDDGTLVLAAAGPVPLFRAAAEWLSAEPAYAVVDLGWERQDTEPSHTLRLRLRHPKAEQTAHAAAAAAG